jgi:hypothetical protein
MTLIGSPSVVVSRVTVPDADERAVSAVSGVCAASFESHPLPLESHIYVAKRPFPCPAKPQYDEKILPFRRRSLASESAQLELSVDAGPATEAAELERLVLDLRSELLELDSEQVELAAAGAPPEGARAAEAIVVGALLVRLARTSDSLSAVVRTVRGWLGPREDRRVRIELDGDVIELSGASDEERDRLVDAWIARHGRD